MNEEEVRESFKTLSARKDKLEKDITKKRIRIESITGIIAFEEGNSERFTRVRPNQKRRTAEQEERSRKKIS